MKRKGGEGRKPDRAAVFLDRDGTLNVEKDYVHRYANWEWIPGAVDGMRKMAGLGFRLVVVSNQSGVARGYYSAADVRALHGQVAKDLHGMGVEVAGFYFCPHGPGEGCDCRKPRPGMVLKAETDLNIDLSRSFLVGDKLIDVQAAQAAGVQPILVGTGYGLKEKAHLPAGVPFVRDLSAAAHWIEGNAILQSH
ncbi:MAG: D-glycero-beta-D-manno-heptose 1,7-bisphosphate 7-phosphatase [Elusimicrobia bacterium]|nr:D-glycero-beta-D-manno-heptose 1,7-bisphosphate 7-phosphatase [Elusimicrobiota bacterium]